LGKSERQTLVDEAVQIFVTTPAEADLKETKAWYDQVRPGLGVEFQLCVDETMARIKQFPNAAPIVTLTIRRALIKRFPYGIFYLSQPSLVQVLAIIHSSRDPTKWRTRAH